MAITRHRVAAFIALGLYAVVLGFLGGMAAECMRGDVRRDAMLRQYEDTLQRWHTV
jgi:H+/gluconate symporter-like permease